MTLPLPRAARLSALTLLVTGGIAPFAPGAAHAMELVAAVRGTPSSLSARYGGALPLGAAAPGRYLVPTRTGFEIREASQPLGDSIVATFRTAGRVDDAVLSGTTAWLAAGNRGLLSVDLSVPAAPILSGSFGALGAIRHVARAPASQTIAAASDSTLFLLRETAGTAPDLLASYRWTDGRSVTRIVGRNDSILVAAFRPSAIPRLFLTLLRVRAGEAPESLWDFQANAHLALDMAWEGATAFVADGDNGILPFHLPSWQLRPPIPLSGNRYVGALDADDSVLVAVGGGNLFARFARGGVFGDSLTGESDVTLPLPPVRVRLVESHAIISCDSESEPAEPDEVGRSALVDHDLGTGVTASPVGPTGRVRRVALDGAFAYAADYTGGLRIYRGASSDSSLVGVLAPPAGAHVFDVALDASRRLAYLASGSAGVEVIDVSDPTAPVRLATVPLPGRTQCVAAIGDTLVAAGWKVSPDAAGLTFIEVTNASVPVPRGSVSTAPGATIRDPRALAPRDTVLFVADDVSGVISATFGNPDVPGIRGIASGVVGTRDLSLSGTILLAATRVRGVEVVDVSSPTRPFLRSEVALPPVYGVTMQGTGAVAFLGYEGAVVIDLSNPDAPSVRGAVESPGFPRGGAWSGDALLVASSLGLERFTLPASLPAEPVLNLSYDSSGGLPRVIASWPPVALPGVTGLNLYREPVGTGSGGDARPARVNGPLLPPTAVTFVDGTVPSGGAFRYRLAAALGDGSAREVAVGTIFISSAARLGRPYPNPFRPSFTGLVSIPYRSQPVSAGAALVRVRIYDVRGRLVRAIASQAQAAGGFGTVTWDGRDGRGVPAASGVYWIHVRAPGIDDAASVVLVR